MSYVDTCVTQGQAYLRGDFAKAERLAKTALEIGEMNLGSSEGPHGVQMFMTRRETGGLDKVRAFITGQESFTGRWLPGMLALYTELGLADGMRRALQGSARRQCRLTPTRCGRSSWPSWPTPPLDLADEEAAVRLAPLPRPVRGHEHGRRPSSSPSSAVPTATWPASPRCSVTRRPREQQFAAALAMDRRMGSVVHDGRDAGRARPVAVQRGRARPRRARELAEQAQALAEPIGQLRVLRWLETGRSAPAGARSASPPARGRGARLLAAGLSNREIGVQLYISANTAANHVRSILAKTGAANRTQAARYATDHRLLT